MSQDPSPPPSPPGPTFGTVHNHAPSQQGTGNVQHIYVYPPSGEDRRLDRRIVLLWSPEDRAAVDPRLQAMAGVYRLAVVQPCQVQAPATEEARAALRAELAAAEMVWVFWSAAARHSPFVGAALKMVWEIEAEEARQREPGAVASTRLVTVPLDETVLGALPRPQRIPWLTGDHPIQAALYSGLNVLGGLGAAGLGIWGWFDGFQGPLWWAMVVGLAALAVVFGVAQRAGRADLVFRAGATYQRGAWLERATVGQILELAERVLNRVYGPKPLSWRAVGVSALVGTGTMLPLAALWAWSVATQVGGAVGADAALSAALQSARLTAPLAVFNLIFDLLALLTTRKVLHRLLQDPRGPRVALGLALDAVLVLLAAVLPLVLNTFARQTLDYMGEVLTDPLAVGSHLFLLLTGGLRLENLGRGLLAAGLLLPALSVITGCLPSLVHGSLLLVAGLNRALGGAPLRLLGWALRGLADRPAGPQEALVPLGALVLAVWTALTTLGSGAAPSEVWVSVPQETCAEGCEIGSPEGESDKRDERRRSVQLRTTFQIQPTEVTQGQWAGVMRRAAKAKLEVWGLPDQPSVYRGEHLPVDSVSWCEAARFANLWSQVEGLPLAYSVAHPEAAADPLGLSGCEEETEILWDHASTGYRLPTEVEWEVAARGCRPGGRCSGERYVLGDQEADLLRAAWVSVNFGRRPHAVASLEPNALGLHDMLGNVWEWTWDFYTPNPAAGMDPAGAVSAGSASRRVIRGGSWGVTPADARAAKRVSLVPGRRDNYLGFRLVRSVGPAPSGSGS